jgi:hypothetical protein
MHIMRQMRLRKTTLGFIDKQPEEIIGSAFAD